MTAVLEQAEFDDDLQSFREREQYRGRRKERLAISLGSSRRRLGLFLAFFLVASSERPAAAAHFANSYVSFDMPDGWTCQLEDTEYVCNPPTPPGGKLSMIVILTAKLVGRTDSPQLYLRHLEEVGRQPGVVVGQAPKQTIIGEALWLDGSFWNSEIKGYETRYLARTEGDLAVTFSAHRSVAARALPISDLIARSVILNSKLARPELRPGPIIRQ